jgi:hypothetical protein
MKDVSMTNPVLGLRSRKGLRQHEQDKSPRGPSTARHKIAVSRDKSLTRFAQDDGLVGGSKNIPVGCVFEKRLAGRTKTRNIQKSHNLSG